MKVTTRKDKARQNEKKSFLGVRKHSSYGRDGLIHSKSRLKQICCHDEFV